MGRTFHVSTTEQNQSRPTNSVVGSDLDAAFTAHSQATTDSQEWLCDLKIFGCSPHGYAVRRRSCLHRAQPGVAVLPKNREADAETGAAPVMCRALAIQMTFGFGNPAGDDSQAEAGALGFRGEKWLQNLFLQVRRNTGAIVFHVQGAESV
jgi:hypothetical protein